MLWVMVSTCITCRRNHGWWWPGTDQELRTEDRNCRRGRHACGRLRAPGRVVLTNYKHAARREMLGPHELVLRQIVRSTSLIVCPRLEAVFCTLFCNMNCVQSAAVRARGGWIRRSSAPVGSPRRPACVSVSTVSCTARGRWLRHRCHDVTRVIYSYSFM